MHSLFVFDPRDIYDLYYDKGGRFMITINSRLTVVRDRLEYEEELTSNRKPRTNLDWEGSILKDQMFRCFDVLSEDSGVREAYQDYCKTL